MQSDRNSLIKILPTQLTPPAHDKIAHKRSSLRRLHLNFYLQHTDDLKITCKPKYYPETGLKTPCHSCLKELGQDLKINQHDFRST